MWVHRDRVHVDSGPPFDQDAFNEYVRWLQRSTRLHIKGAYTDRAVEEGSEEDVVEDEYDVETRLETQPQRASLMPYVASQLTRMSNKTVKQVHNSRGGT